jgi:putative NADH-flavin reductase
MRLAIFGGSGKTGLVLLKLAWAAGHEVTVLARNPASIGLSDGLLTTVQGSIVEAEKVSQVIQGAEAVISVLGPAHNRPTYEISAGMDHILAAMKALGVRRLVVTLGAGVRDPADSPPLFDRLILGMLKLSARYVLEDMLRVDEKVRRSNTDWTIVRVPMLTSDPPTGKVRVGMLGQGVGPRLGRADLAGFLLGQLNDETYLHKAPAISS